MSEESEKKVLGILPARSGSKGLPGKNLKILAGRPLISWAATELANSTGVDVAVCSTDSKELAELAMSCGLQIAGMRPAELASDHSPVVETVKYTLEQLANSGSFFDYVILVQATSPTVNRGQIAQAAKMLRSNRFDSVITVTEVPHNFSPSLIFRESERGELLPLGTKDQLLSRRQDLENYWARSGQIYGAHVNVIRRTNSFYGENIGSIRVPGDEAISIDDLSDFVRAEQYFSNRGEE